MRRLSSRFPAQRQAVCAVLCWAATGVPLHSQDSSGAAVIRAETRTVLVDAVAVDKKGRFVRDLTAKDFKIEEDNKEQTISGFSLESSGVTPERPSRHFVVMFFDTSSASRAGIMAARQGGLRFIDGFASPDRYIAVATSFGGGLSVEQNFTADADLLKKALGRVSINGGTEPAASSATPVPIQTARGTKVNDSAPGNNFAYRGMLESVRTLAASLGTIRGRKALVLFSGDVPATGDMVPEIQETIDACNKANVAIYAVSSGSVSGDTSSGVSAMPTPRGNQGGSHAVEMPELSAAGETIPSSLAESTGGIAFRTTSDPAALLGKIVQEQDQYYLLSYTPAIDSAEGSCHNLKVKVDRGGIDVRARKSYCTSKPADVLSGQPAGASLEARAAGNSPGNMSAKMQLPWFYAAPNAARVSLAMEIIPSGMKFRKDKGKYEGELDLAGVAYKPDGTAAARVSDVVKPEFDSQQEAEEFLKTPYHYENQFEIAPGQYKFRMAFNSGADTQNFGKVEIPLTIDPWNGETLAVSGIALSHDTHPATDLTAGLDVSLLEGQRPLIANGAEIVPSGDSVFHSGDPAFFYFEAYEPLLTAAKPNTPLPVIGIRVRVLERSTGKQMSDTGAHSAGNFERAGNSTVPVYLPLPVAGLPAGAYRLEVSVMRQTGAPLVRTADFDLN